MNVFAYKSHFTGYITSLSGPNAKLELAAVRWPGTANLLFVD